MALSPVLALNSLHKLIGRKGADKTPAQEPVHNSDLDVF